MHCYRFAPVFYCFGSYWSQPFIRLLRRACGWPAILVVAPSSLWRQRTRRSRVKEKESNSRRRTVGSLSKIEFIWRQKIWIWRTQKNYGLKKVVKEKERNSRQRTVGSLSTCNLFRLGKFGINPWTMLSPKTIYVRDHPFKTSANFHSFCQDFGVILY